MTSNPNNHTPLENGHVCSECMLERQGSANIAPTDMTIDEAIRKFKGYVLGENDFDELDFKEVLESQRQADYDALMAELAKVRSGVDYNKHDMGELGEFIRRTQYVYNRLDQFQQLLDKVYKGE